ncbi:MAG: zinc-binding dehydrogenase [Clostridiales bacterium]|nr:zinc-binding dehydrogenase [Clostridiales bacterium]
MKKLVMTGPGKSTVVDVEQPIPQKGEILVKIRYCGVCMSEHDDFLTAAKGRTFGHEAMGVVAALGPETDKFKIGDRVTGLGLEAFAEYGVFKESNLILVPSNVADEDATVEPLSCLVSALSKIPVDLPGGVAAVIGAGYMGLGFISLLKLKGVKDIIAVDIREEALENAKKFGATQCYLPEDLPKEYVADWDDIYGGGLDLVCEWAGTEEALNLAGKMTKIDGLLAIGGYHTGGARKVDVQLWNVKALTVLSTHERKDDFQMFCAQRAMDLLSSGQWDYKNLNTKIYTLREFDLAQEEIMTKPNNMIKALVDCTKW